MAAGIPEEELQRLRRQAEGATCQTLSTSTIEFAADDSVALAGPRRLKITVARDLDSDAMELMTGLSSSPIEVLALRNCPQIPAAAWQKVRGAKWLNLKKADFGQCLAERNVGVGVLSCFLRVYFCRCWMLSEFRFEYRFVKLSYELGLICMGLRWSVYLHLSLSQRVFDRLFLTKHCRSFDSGTQGADGAADLLEALSHSTQLEELDFTGCSQIPAGAWQKVRSAKWLHLKKADFRQCLAERNGWGLSCYMRVFICLYWKLFEFSSIVRMMKLSYKSEQPQRIFDSLFLTKHCRCFEKVAQGADGAADLLEALSQSSLLEELDFSYCFQIPATAWQKVRGAKWLNLKKADFSLCLAERNGWRFSCFLRRVFICLCWMLSEFWFVKICDVVVWVGVDL